MTWKGTSRTSADGLRLESGKFFRAERAVTEFATRLHGGAVVVAAGGDQHSQLGGPTLEGLGLVRRVLGVEGFDRVEPGFRQHLELLSRDAVRAGMGHARRAARAVDDLHR